MWLVCVASADSSVSGSKLAMYCAERRQRLDVRLADAEIVGQKDHVELAALGGARDVEIVLEVDAGVGLRARMPPRGDMMPGRIEEGAEPHLAFAAHRLLVTCCAPGAPLLFPTIAPHTRNSAPARDRGG